MATPSQILELLSCFGPDQPFAWQDLSNVNKLCQRCSKVDWTTAQMYLAVADEYSFYPKVPLYNNYPTISALRDSAHEGCHLCALILTCLLTMRYRHSVNVDPLPIGLHAINDRTRVTVEIEATAKNPPVCLKMSLDEVDSELSDWLELSIPILEELPHSAFSASNCLNNHQKCANRENRLPRRLLDISEGHQPCLITDPQFNAKYAALSYSLGGYPVITTTWDTIDARKEGIRYEDLPKTVQDAIWWTRKLGIDYLWIDSLCILQDNLHDWEIELSKMSEIYQNATVTIAATAANNAGTGCMPNRNKLNLIPCEPVNGIVVVPDFNRHIWIYSHGALEQRAWTFQQTQLCHRVLRCGGEETVWQCRTCKRTERNPKEEIRQDSGGFSLSFGTRAFDFSGNLNFMKIESARSFLLWYQLVQPYNSRNLTFSGDKLPAFAGMAARFQNQLESVDNAMESAEQTASRAGWVNALKKQIPEVDWNEVVARGPTRQLSDQKGNQNILLNIGLKSYLAGLWRDDLLHGLLWRRMALAQIVPYRAPSWSWAALEGHTAWNWHGLQSDNFSISALDVQVIVPGLNPYGRVASGKLTLLGPVAPAPSHANGDDSDFGTWKWQWPLLTWDAEGSVPLGCVCLRIQEACCLILAPVETRWRPQTYRRVGMLVLPTELEDLEGVKKRILDELEWREEVMTLI